MPPPSMAWLRPSLRFSRRAFVGGAATLAAIAAGARDAGNRWRDVDKAMRELAPGRLPGLAAMIGRGSGPADFLGVGTLAQGSAVPIDPDSLWRVYSMTKPITGIAVMMLVEDGLLRLDQPVSDVLPAFARPQVLIDPDRSLASREATREITIRHLLTHSSGLGYSFLLKGPLLAEYRRLGILPLRASRRDDPFLGAFEPAPSLATFADRLATLPLLADPGTRWIYGVGLDLLGRVIEVVSGKAFDSFLQQRLFDPLGMISTFWRVPASQAGRLVTNHIVRDGRLLPLDPGPTSVYLDAPAFPFGGAGLVSSARDYDRFLAMLVGQGAIGRTRVLRPEMVALGMSDLLPAGIDTRGTYADGQGFGAGGRVTVRPTPGGPGKGSFGWEGIAATIGWVDPARGLRAAGFAQYLPDPSLGFPEAFSRAVYADAGSGPGVRAR